MSQQLRFTPQTQYIHKLYKRSVADHCTYLSNVQLSFVFTTINIRSLFKLVNIKVLLPVFPEYAREQRICLQPRPSRASRKKQLKRGKGFFASLSKQRTGLQWSLLLHAIPKRRNPPPSPHLQKTNCEGHDITTQSQIR